MPLWVPLCGVPAFGGRILAPTHQQMVDLSLPKTAKGV